MPQYVTAADLRAYLADVDVAIVSNAELDLLAQSASGEVDGWCGRTFDQSTLTPRVFAPVNRYRVDVDDISMMSGVTVAEDRDDDGVFETPVSLLSLQAEPVNAISDGVTGWPVTSLRLVDGSTWANPRYRSHTVQVTAQWGWSAVPEQVKRATLLIAAELHKMEEAPLGVAGFGDFGPVRVRQMPQVPRLLGRFRRLPGVL